NTKGLQLPKFLAVRQWLSEGVDLVGVLESWYLNQHFYAADPSFLVASEPLPSSPSWRRKDDGLVILASPRVRESVISITRSHFFIRLVLPGLTIGFVYAPPRLSDAAFLEIFRNLEDCDVVLGDLNVRIDPMLGSSGSAAPLGRYHALALWMSASDFCALPPSLSSASSRWDHVLVKHSLWDSLSSALQIIDSATLDIKTDHPALHLRFPLLSADSEANAVADPDPGLSRIHLGRLHKPGAWQRLQDVYSALCPAVDLRLQLAEDAVRAEALGEVERQAVVDAVDGVLHEAVLAAGFGTLGQYDVKVARSRPDWTKARLEESANSFDAERLWRKALRGKDRPLVASAAAGSAGISVKKEAAEFWGSVWGAEGAPPVQPPDGRLPPRPVRVDADPLASHFTIEAVERAIRRYPKHKSGGEDGDHGLLLAALSYTQPLPDPGTIPSPPRPAPSPSPAQSPALPAPGSVRCSARLQARRSTLNPRAAPFVPLSTRPPPAPEQLPFPVQLARLFRLCAACRVIPRRWGRALVHLIPKDKLGLPTPQTSRPIAMLPMFRRLFESIFVRQLTGDSRWARLHPGQSGFRRGWSCASALLCNHVASSSRPIAIYLDLQNAFASVGAEDEMDVLRQRDAPLAVRQQAWALLTTGACASLVVNGSRTEVIPLWRGLQQGSICSPAFFNLLIDELLHILNAGRPPEDPAAIFYADDGALLAQDALEAQKLLDQAAEWAKHRGLRFNVRKCGVVAHVPISLTLAGQGLPQVPSYRYLGIPRSPDGLDLASYLERKLEAMRGVLRRLRAVGGNWTSMGRLAVFQSHCASLLDFGGGLVHHFSLLPSSTISPTQLDDLDSFFDDAACWITDLPSRRRLVAHSMCGMVTGRLRLEHLALGLEQHLASAHRRNPASALLRRQPPAHALGHSELIASLRASPLSVSFLRARREQQRAHPDWVLLSRRVFLRRERRQWLREHTGLLGARIEAPHRMRGLADRVLTIATPQHRLLASRWRAGTAFCRARCFCGATWSRRHIPCLMSAPGFSTSDDPHTATILASSRQELGSWARAREAMADLHLIDYLLGHFHFSWHSLAIDTLQLWHQALLSHNAPILPIARL
ncbi:hypothetical protein CF319_g8879, partial [Tilletia indica]